MGNCHCVEGGTLLAILCYLALTDWSIGEIRGAKMFNPSNAIFLSTEHPSWNERKKKNPKKLEKHSKHGPQVCDYHGVRKEAVPHFWAQLCMFAPTARAWCGTVLPTARRALRGIPPTCRVFLTSFSGDLSEGIPMHPQTFLFAI